MNKIYPFLKFFAIAVTALFWIGCTITDSDDGSDNAFFEGDNQEAQADAPAPEPAQTQPQPDPEPTPEPDPEPQQQESQRTEPTPAPAPAPAPAPSNNNAVSGGGSAVGGGFVYKPISEGDGNLVILTPSSVNATAMTISGGFGSENGRYVGRTNGNRATFRFSRPGCGYGNNIRVNTNGGASYNIPSGCTRVDL